jgi:flavin reductase (DIM6/NTAB) family NADH-FMN oxidoreductase RutF
MEKDPDRQALGNALGKIPSGVFIVTMARDGEESALLASWVQQCSFDPPCISVAVRPDRPICRLLTEGSCFTLNILDDSQTDMIAHFGRGFEPGAPAFDGIDVERPAEGDPILSEALAYLRCQVIGRLKAGDHDVFLGRLIAGRVLNDGHPMIHIRKSGFHY